MELRRIAICGDCLTVLRGTGEPKQLRLGIPAAQHYPSRRSISSSISRHIPAATRNVPVRQQRILSRRYATATAPQNATPAPASNQDLNAIHARIQELSASVLRPEDSPVPEEQRVLYVLEQLDALAKRLIDVKSLGESISNAPKQGSTATSALLGSVNARQAPSSVTKATLLSLISQRAEEIMRHDNVFITPGILKAYVELQTMLHQPSSFPDVLTLYAHKPVPKANSDKTVSFSPATPDKVNTAVDSTTADTALSAAITAHDLPLAIDIINTTFCTRSFRLAKTLRQALVPGAGLALAPVAAYTLSQAFSSYQSMLDPSQATTMAFAGIMTYVSAVAMTGYVAITTANDQMERVTWAQGVPLWERWVREEERSAIDRVAVAWGFKGLEKRGDEEGPEWEELREWVGRRGMVLDAVGLMDGME